MSWQHRPHRRGALLNLIAPTILSAPEPQKSHGAFGPSQQKHEPLCASLVVRSRPPPSLPRSVVNWIPDAADRSPNRCETASNTRPTSRNRATPPTTMPEPSSVEESGQPPEAAPKERSGRYRSPNQTRRTARRMSPAIMTTTAGGPPAFSGQDTPCRQLLEN